MDFNALYMSGIEPKPRMERFWICYVEGSDGGEHYKHFDLCLAEKEAERLAKLRGKTVYLLECIGKCYAEIKWEIPHDV